MSYFIHFINTAKFLTHLVLLLFINHYFVQPTQAQSFSWARGIGSSLQDQSNSIVVDGSGNVYTTGSFSGTADFDPGIGIANLVSTGSSDIFISKLDGAGNYIWAKRIGGSNTDVGRSITVDKSGNVLITGHFIGTVDFDPGPGTANLTSIQSSNVFMCKLDNAGNYVWAKLIGGNGGRGGLSIAVDGSGNVYTTGSFSGTADFDPGPAIANLSSYYGFDDDIFISKLNATGNYVWAKNIGGQTSDFSASMAVDESGNVYITGELNGTADFDPGVGVANLTSSGGIDIFVSKLNASGTYVWAKKMGGDSHDNSQSLALDKSGNILITGRFNGNADFDPGPSTAILTSTTVFNPDIFISKLDAFGNYIWAKRIGNENYENSNSIAVDGSSNVYIVGTFSGIVDFDPGLDMENITSGTLDTFVCKLDPSGKYIWAKNAGGNTNDFTSYSTGISVSVDLLGNVFYTGAFKGTVDFDPGQNTLYLSSVSSDLDIYISKLGVGLSSPKLTLSSSTVCTGSAVSLTVTSTEANAYYWTAPDGVVLSNPASGSVISATITVTGIKTFTVTAVNGSNQSSATASVTSIGMSSTKAGSWTNPDTWSCNRVPTITDVVTIGHLVSLPSGTIQVATKVKYVPGGVIYFNGGSKLKLSQ